MRKEIIGILLFFLVIFTLISLVSYHPADPSIHTAKASGHVHNLFGLFGAHVAGFLVGLFGLGAFWVPVLLLISSIEVFGSGTGRSILRNLFGGMLLIITTGSLLAFQQNHFILFGKSFSSGGIIGLPLKSFLLRYSSFTGGNIILILLWVIGFILTTGFSLVNFGKRLWNFTLISAALVIDSISSGSLIALNDSTKLSTGMSFGLGFTFFIAVSK